MTDHGRPHRVLRYIVRYVDEHGYAPSIRDITVACRISSTSVAASAVGLLEKAGYIKRTPELSRSIVLTQEGRDAIEGDDDGNAERPAVTGLSAQPERSS